MARVGDGAGRLFLLDVRGLQPLGVMGRAGRPCRDPDQEGAGESLANASSRRDSAAPLQRASPRKSRQGILHFCTSHVHIGNPIVQASEADPGPRVAVARVRWGLTPRQAEVLQLVAQGMSNRAVAASLGCSEGTIELHVTSVLDKAECESRAQLVARLWTTI